MPNQKLTFDDLNRIEKIGLIWQDIDEHCIGIDDNDYAVYKSDGLSKLNSESSPFIQAKTDYENGRHSGDCTHAPGSCVTCHWHDMVSNGYEISVYLAREQSFGTKQLMHFVSYQYSWETQTEHVAMLASVLRDQLTKRGLDLNNAN